MLAPLARSGVDRIAAGKAKHPDANAGGLVRVCAVWRREREVGGVGIKQAARLFDARRKGEVRKRNGTTIDDASGGLLSSVTV